MCCGSWLHPQDKTKQDIYFSDPQIKNIKYIQIVMYDSYWGGNEGSSIILNRLSTCYPQILYYDVTSSE